LPNTKSAMKAMRNSERRRVRNRVHRSSPRTYVKRARALIEAGRLEEAREAVQLAARALDRAAQKGVIHQNNAARRKSRLMQMLNRALAQ
jgi:small subunit ribosomal protein S20